MTKKTLITAIILLILAVSAYADTVEYPIKVVLARADAATRSIPRWKAYMNPTNPNEVWLGLANWGSTSTHLLFSNNGCQSWNSSDLWLTDNHVCDNHLSIAGDSAGNVYAVMPQENSLLFRKVNYPGHSEADLDPLRTVISVAGLPRGNVMVQPDNQRVWVFTRVSAYPTENVRYHYTDNGGQSWTSGVADATFEEEVRIGSMPYIDGRPALVVAYMGSTTLGYRYYMWNGSSFQAYDDAQIHLGSVGYDRHYAHNVTSGNIMHMIVGLDNTLYHYWKPFNNGTGSWNVETVDASPYTGGTEWETACAVRGSDLYIFYAKKSSTSLSSSNIYYSKWHGGSQSLESPVLLSTHAENTNNHWPNSVMEVPVSSSYIPVVWYSHLSDNNEQVYSTRILVDSTAVRLDIDMKIKEFKEGSATVQDVIDMIELYNSNGTQ